MQFDSADDAKHQCPPCENIIGSLPERRSWEQDQQTGRQRLLKKNPAPGCLHQRSISGSRNVCPSHAAIGGTSGSGRGPGWDRSGENPFSLFLMHISPEKVCVSEEEFVEFLSLRAACVPRTDCSPRTRRRKRLTVLYTRK